VESLEVSFESFKTVPRRSPKVLNFCGGIQVLKFSLGDSSEFRRKLPRGLGAAVKKEVFCEVTPKGTDHITV